MLHLTNANGDKNSSVSKINLDVYQRGGWKVEGTCLHKTLQKIIFAASLSYLTVYDKSGNLHLLNVEMLWFSANSILSQEFSPRTYGPINQLMLMLFHCEWTAEL